MCVQAGLYNGWLAPIATLMLSRPCPQASLAPSTHAVATVAKVGGELRRRRFGPAIPLARSRSGAGGR